MRLYRPQVTLLLLVSLIASSLAGTLTTDFALLEAIESASVTGGVKDQGEGDEAHAVVGKSSISTEDVETSSRSDGKREESLTLAGFDILRFKNNFLEARNGQI